MVNQILCKVARDPETMNRFNYADKGWEAADRSFANFNEQTAPFLGLLWLFATFVSAEDAALHGAVYVAFRCCFLPFWAMGGKWTVLIELSTQPCYAVLSLWKASLLHKMATGTALRALLPDQTPEFIAALAAMHVAMQVGSLVIFGGISTVINKAFPAPKPTSKTK